MINKFKDVVNHFPDAEFSPFGETSLFGNNYYKVSISKRITLIIYERDDDIYIRSCLYSEPDQYDNIMMNFMDHLIKSIADIDVLVTELMAGKQ